MEGIVIDRAAQLRPARFGVIDQKSGLMTRNLIAMPGRTSLCSDTSPPRRRVRGIPPKVQRPRELPLIRGGPFVRAFAGLYLLLQQNDAGHACAAVILGGRVRSATVVGGGLRDRYAGRP